MDLVAGGQAAVSWYYFFRNPSCIAKARSFASMSSKKLAETRVSRGFVQMLTLQNFSDGLH